VHAADGRAVGQEPQVPGARTLDEQNAPGHGSVGATEDLPPVFARFGLPGLEFERGEDVRVRPPAVFFQRLEAHFLEPRRPDDLVRVQLDRALFPVEGDGLCGADLHAGPAVPAMGPFNKVYGRVGVFPDGPGNAFRACRLAAAAVYAELRVHDGG